MKRKDAINPAHYKSGGLEAIDVIESFGLGYRLGNAVKYILRAGRKGPSGEDLTKSAWYLLREMSTSERAKALKSLAQQFSPGRKRFKAVRH